MNYYDEILEKIQSLLEEKDYSLAEKIIDDELNVPYVPREIEQKLYELKSRVVHDSVTYKLTDDQIEEYLYHGDPVHQLKAVEELDDKNLREYKMICSRYLMGNGFLNAKLLLIDSMIRQEINEEFICVKDGKEYSFNPSELPVIENSASYLKATTLLDEVYLKEPSKLYLAKQLLYKEFMMSLPVIYTEQEAEKLVEKITAYIGEAFGSAN